VAVWMKLDATSGQTTAIKSKLSRTPTVDDCLYRSHLADYQQAKKLLPGSEFAALTIQTTPASFQCTLIQPGQQRNLVVEFAGQPGVRDVTVPSTNIKS